MKDHDDIPRLTGEEQFRIRGQSIGELGNPTVRGFWSWSTSDLLDNTTRGFVAEYLVANALDSRDPYRFRTKTWSSWDLETDEGLKIEVKTTAICQTWHDETDAETVPMWSIAPISVYDWETKSYSEHKYRPADLYVFCLHAHRDLETLDATDLSQWEFYVLSTKVLDAERPNGKSIRLSSLKRLGATKVSFPELKAAILC